MFKTFILGLILGLAATGGIVYVFPAVNLERERTINTVNPNGGTVEHFHANLPGDRIMASANGGDQVWPERLFWPEYVDIGDAQVELFKLRNENDTVVAVASRMQVSSPEAEVEWTVHMPARGTLYALVSGRPDESGARVGRLRAGSLEFETRSGRVFERYDSSPGSHGGDDGRLILTTILVNDAYDLELEEATMAEVSQ